MKKLLALTLALTLSATLISCSSSSEPTPSESASTSGSAQTSDAAANETTAADFTVEMVTDSGGVNDQGFNQSGWEGLQKFGTDTGAKVNYIESQQTADYQPNLEKAVDDNSDLIWGVGYMMADAEQQEAAINPDVNFAIIDNGYSDDQLLPNLTGVTFRAQEPAFLCGYMAGLMTKSDKVGFIGGIEGTVMNQFQYGYQAGVQYAAKELGTTITVDAQYSETYDDTSKGKALAESMYTNGDDIVFVAAGQCGQGSIEAAKEMNQLIIGCDLDQSYLAPDNVMTSCLKDTGAAVYDISKEMMDGQDIGGQNIDLGIADGACGIPTYDGSTANLVPEDVYNKTMDIQDKIVNGEIVPPNSSDSYTTFISAL